MKKVIAVSFVVALLMSLVALAQDTMKKSDDMKQDTMKSEKAPKLSTISGKISEDGTTFVTDKDSKTWKIVNPEAVKGHEGHHVSLKAHVYPDKNEVHVMGVKMMAKAKDEMKEAPPK
jgi:pentapeptide MXKDX repeat protein